MILLEVTLEHPGVLLVDLYPLDTQIDGRIFSICLGQLCDIFRRRRHLCLVVSQLADHIGDLWNPLGFIHFGKLAVNSERTRQNGSSSSRAICCLFGSGPNHDACYVYCGPVLPASAIEARVVGYGCSKSVLV